MRRRLHFRARRLVDRGLFVAEGRVELRQKTRQVVHLLRAVRRAAGDNVVAISAQAPAERFREKDQGIVTAFCALAGDESMLAGDGRGTPQDPGRAKSLTRAQQVTAAGLMNSEPHS
jgi:hypothetical protein